MTIEQRIEVALSEAVARTSCPGAPPTLSRAISYAVFPGGARIRPRLCLAVAEACGGTSRKVSVGAGAAIELMHCASLVHDDLPCFDDAAMRRGKPSVHRAFGEPIAVLAGDAMIVLAFETLCEAVADTPRAAPALMRILSDSVSAARGIIGGQAWESEPVVDVAAYQRAKTGSLFVAAVRAGAVAADNDPTAWRALGEKLGEAYQVADDLHDAFSKPEDVGKPVGQDGLHGRPNVIAEHGVTGGVGYLKQLIREAVDSVPNCAGQTDLRAMIEAETRRFIPRQLAARAA